MSSLRLAVIIGSTREGRNGPRVANWFADIARAHGTFEVDVIDLTEYGLPARMGQGHPKQGNYPAELQPFAARIAAADALVLVTPEYNHGYPASLKAGLDALFAEWLAKPVSFVSYGGASGGMRAVEQLRQVVAELHMVDIRETISIPFIFNAMNEDGTMKDSNYVTVANAVLGQLSWWASALKNARTNSPYKP